MMEWPLTRSSRMRPQSQSVSGDGQETERYAGVLLSELFWAKLLLSIIAENSCVIPELLPGNKGVMSNPVHQRKCLLRFVIKDSYNNYIITKTWRKAIFLFICVSVKTTVTENKTWLRPEFQRRKIFSDLTASVSVNVKKNPSKQNEQTNKQI